MSRSLGWHGIGLVLAVLLSGCSSGNATAEAEAPAAPATPVVPPTEPAETTCDKGGLVDAGFRDAALAALSELVVHAPGLAADGAVRSNSAPGHIDPSGQAWHFISAYQVNLALMEALRVAPGNAPVAAGWLRWQARHTTPTGAGQGVVFDHWIRASDLHVAPCPPGRALGDCPHVDAYDSTAASVLLMADAYLAATGDSALLRETAVRAALQSAAGAVVALTQPEGLSSAKPGYLVEYLMDAAEVAAGWRAWARVQESAYGDGAGAQASLAAAQRMEDAMRRQLWHAPSQAWRVSLQAGAPDFSVWYADTVAQAWPLLWRVRGPAAADAASAWRKASARWQGANGWPHRNVDPDGFWWPAAAVAARCVGDVADARSWVARARAAWLAPANPFAWPFQVGDLRWLFWLSDPVAAAARP